MEDQAASHTAPLKSKDKGSQDVAANIKDLSLTGTRKKSNAARQGSKSTGYRTPGDSHMDAYRNYNPRVFYPSSSKIPRPLSSSDPSGSSWALRGQPPCQVHCASISPSQSSFSNRSASGYPLPSRRKSHGARRSIDSSDLLYAKMPVNLLDQHAFHKRSWHGSEGSSLHSPHGHRNPGGGRQSHDIASTSGLSNVSNRSGHSFKKPSKKEDKPYETYMSVGEVQQRLKKGEVIEGILRINPRNYEDAYITAPNGQMDIYIEGLPDRNRALNGDRVAVLIKPPSQWKILKDQLRNFTEEVLSTEPSSCLPISNCTISPILEKPTAAQPQDEPKSKNKGQRRKRKKKTVHSDEIIDAEAKDQKPEFQTDSLESNQNMGLPPIDPFSAHEMSNQSWLDDGPALENWNWDGLCHKTRASDSLEILGIDKFQQQVLNLNKNGLNRANNAKSHNGFASKIDKNISHPSNAFSCSAQIHVTSSCTDDDDPWTEGMNDPKPNNIVISPFDLLDLTNTPPELLPILEEEETKNLKRPGQISSSEDEGARFAVPPDDLSENDFYSDASVDSTASYQADAYMERTILLTLYQDATNNNVNHSLFVNGWLEDSSSTYASLSEAEVDQSGYTSPPHAENAAALRGSLGDEPFEMARDLSNGDFLCQSSDTHIKPFHNFSSEGSSLNIDHNSFSYSSDNNNSDEHSQEKYHISYAPSSFFKEPNTVNVNKKDDSNFSSDISVDSKVEKKVHTHNRSDNILEPALDNRGHNYLDGHTPSLRKNGGFSKKGEDDCQNMILNRSTKNVAAFLGNLSSKSVEGSEPFNSNNLFNLSSKTIMEPHIASLHDDIKKINISDNDLNDFSQRSNEANSAPHPDSITHSVNSKLDDNEDIMSSFDTPDGSSQAFSVMHHHHLEKNTSEASFGELHLKNDQENDLNAHTEQSEESSKSDADFINNKKSSTAPGGQRIPFVPPEEEETLHSNSDGFREFKGYSKKEDEDVGTALCIDEELNISKQNSAGPGSDDQSVFTSNQIDNDPLETCIFSTSPEVEKPINEVNAVSNHKACLSQKHLENEINKITHVVKELFISKPSNVASHVPEFKNTFSEGNKGPLPKKAKFPSTDQKIKSNDETLSGSSSQILESHPLFNNNDETHKDISSDRNGDAPEFNGQNVATGRDQENAEESSRPKKEDYIKFPSDIPGVAPSNNNKTSSKVTQEMDTSSLISSESTKRKRSRKRRFENEVIYLENEESATFNKSGKENLSKGSEQGRMAEAQEPEKAPSKNKADLPKQNNHLLLKSQIKNEQGLGHAASDKPKRKRKPLFVKNDKSCKNDEHEEQESSAKVPEGKCKKPVAFFIETTASQKLAETAGASNSGLLASSSGTLDTDETSLKSHKKKNKKRKNQRKPDNEKKENLQDSTGVGVTSEKDLSEKKPARSAQNVLSLLNEKSPIEESKKKKKNKRKPYNEKKENLEKSTGDAVTSEKHLSEKKPARSTQSALPLLNERSPIEEIMKHPKWEKFIQKTGKVVCILEKKSSSFTAGHIRLQRDKSKKWALFVPNDHRFPRLFIPMDQCPKNFYERPGDYAHTLFLASLSEWPEDEKFARGNLIRSLGQEGDVDVETEAILWENGVDFSEFPDGALDGLPLEEEWHIPQEEYEQRRDFRSTCVFTIDPATARDLDDALSCIPLENGNFEVGVHIADVSFFVKEDTKLDEIAQSRATSVYLVQKVVPMLPRVLCERLCSLTPGEDKLTFSVVWEMTPEGLHVGNPWFGRSIIKSCAQFSYDHIHEILQKPEDEELTPSAFPKLYGVFDLSDVARSVRHLNKMAVSMRERRFEGGALRLDQIKLHFELDQDNGLPFGFSQYQQKDSHRLVEEFMLYANMAVAHQIYNHFPDQALLRRHPPPQTKMLADLVEMCAFMGIEIDSSTAGSLQKSISRYMSNDMDDLASLLRVSSLTTLCAKTMMCALYFCPSGHDDPEYFHHYALNVPLYTHFTSPIRRYPDIIVHRLLAASIGLQDAPLLKGKSLDRCADHCNDKKYSARRVHELSCELFLNLFIHKLGKLSAKGMVISILDHSLDVLVDKLGIVKRVYCDKLDYKFSHQQGVSKMLITWKKDHRKEGSDDEGKAVPIVQTLQLFSIVDVLITPQKGETLKLNAMLLPPS